MEFQAAPNMMAIKMYLYLSTSENSSKILLLENLVSCDNLLSEKNTVLYPCKHRYVDAWKNMLEKK